MFLHLTGKALRDLASRCGAGAGHRSRKDLRQRLRDRSALLVAIVVPLVLASIFGLIFHNAIGGRVTFKLRARRPGPRPGGAGVRLGGAGAARAPAG